LIPASLSKTLDYRREKLSAAPPSQKPVHATGAAFGNREPNLQGPEASDQKVGAGFRNIPMLIPSAGSSFVRLNGRMAIQVLHRTIESVLT
jgi:hypothetical protein